MTCISYSFPESHPLHGMCALAHQVALYERAASATSYTPPQGQVAFGRAALVRASEFNGCIDQEVRAMHGWRGGAWARDLGAVVCIGMWPC